jgi:hypothetical protein
MPRLLEKENTWRTTFTLLRIATVLFLDCSVLAVRAEQEPLGFRIPYTSLIASLNLGLFYYLPLLSFMYLF